MEKSLEPLVSVIIPVYKTEAYLEKCVRSVIEQTYKNLEIILVDDGSPDNCPIICDSLAAEDGRISVIHKDNGGLSDARNKGMSVCNGEYFFLLIQMTISVKMQSNYLYKKRSQQIPILFVVTIVQLMRLGT